MKFTKMHGIGNDYVYVSTFDQEAPANPSKLAVAVSDRHFGIGSDGLILITPSDKADARMNEMAENYRVTYGRTPTEDFLRNWMQDLAGFIGRVYTVLPRNA